MRLFKLRCVLSVPIASRQLMLYTLQRESSSRVPPCRVRMPWPTIEMKNNSVVICVVEQCLGRNSLGYVAVLVPPMLEYKSTLSCSDKLWQATAIRAIERSEVGGRRGRHAAGGKRGGRDGGG